MTILYDVTLRDGNHALRHQLSAEFVADYCDLAERSGVWAVEVGHGNGLGASSFLVGKSGESDESLLTAARDNLSHAKLAVHAIPGFATIQRDLYPALELGVDVFRIATHVTEASVAQTHIDFLAEAGATVHGVLMMSHMATVDELVNQVSLMLSYGASAVILMDSAGHFTPADVATRVRAIQEETGADLGFHAHNNLGVGVANAITAATTGASIIDGAAMGLGAGSGNAQLECLVACVRPAEVVDAAMETLLDMSRLVETSYPGRLPRTNASSVESGLAGVFSGYAPQVAAVSSEVGVDPSLLWQELGRRKLVAGQESMIREIAIDLMNL